MISSVPQIAWTAPPPSPTMPRIELEKNVASNRAMPLLMTVQPTDTSGTMAMAKALETMPVTNRSNARRAPSTMREIV